jgi:outer membrane receptor protein involved in Fe transport
MISIKSAASVTRKLFSGLAAVVLVLGLATSAQAQQSGGSIRGHVAGADGATVVEVRDESRGTTKSKATGSDGMFRFDGLTTGSYEVRVLQGGNMVDSATVTVSLGSATTVAMATTVEAIEEIVTTGTRVAALDTSIAESGLVITADALLEMPVQRDLTSVALLAPGTSRGDYRFGGNGNVAFAGASIAENTSFINGLNTTNFRTGVGFSQVPFEFYETLQIKTGGYSAKYGRSLGGVMNAKSKSGSNDWNFGANVYYESQINESPETFLSANKLDKNDETTFDVFASGPIIKDRLFFYALYSDNGQDQRYAGLQSGRDFDYEVDEGFWGFKLDAYITDNHHLEYTNFSDERTGIEGVYAFDSVTQTRGAYIGDTLYERGGDNWIATYTGDFGDNISLSVSYGENEAGRTTAPASANIPVVYEYTDAGGFAAQGEWSNFTVSEGTDTREMTRVDLEWVVGNHDLSFGFDSESNFSDEATINSGGVYWLLDPLNEYNLCSPTDCPQGANARRRTYSVGGSFETNSDAFYIQDVWQVNDRWTLELGLRNENFENLNADGDVFVEVENQWAPRLSAVFDPKGDGTSKFFANYGLYYLPIAANTNIRMAGNETYIQDYFDWDGVSVDGQFVPTGLGAQFDQDLFGDGTVPDTRSVTDVNLDAMYQSEIILGYQRFLDSGVELGVKAIYRNLETTIEDVAIDAAVIDYYNSAGSWDDTQVGGDTVEDVFSGFHQYVLTNPGNDMLVYIPEQDEFIDLTADQLGYPEAERQYGALEFTTARPFDGRWGAQMSYTWSHSWGNHEGYVKSDNGQDDAGITQNFDQPGLTDGSKGNLPNDRRHTIKAFGTYQLDNGLRFGANFLWQSGRPVSCFGVHPTDVFAQAYGADSHFCGGESVQRGSLGTTPDIMTVDATAQYSMDMGGANVLWTLDVFNLFDSANPTLYNEFFETDGGAADSDYGLIQQYQQPRTLRLSARLRF